MQMAEPIAPLVIFANAIIQNNQMILENKSLTICPGLAVGPLAVGPVEVLVSSLIHCRSG